MVLSEYKLYERHCILKQTNHDAVSLIWGCSKAESAVGLKWGQGSDYNVKCYNLDLYRM